MYISRRISGFMMTSNLVEITHRDEVLYSRYPYLTQKDV